MGFAQQGPYLALGRVLACQRQLHRLPGRRCKNLRRSPWSRSLAAFGLGGRLNGRVVKRWPDQLLND
jgi:hypothetical protein